MHAYFSQSVSDVLNALECNKREGLSQKAVERHRRSWGKNELPEPRKISLAERIGCAFKEPMTLLLILALFLLIGVNTARWWHGGETDFAECIGVSVAIFLSVGISIGMEGHSARAFRALRKIGADVSIPALRGGRWQSIRREELVVGDLIRIGAGDKVAADGRLIEAYELCADESALTGESLPVEKTATAVLPEQTPVAERSNMLYAGSFIVSGSGLLVITAVGLNTEFGRIAAALADWTAVQTPLQHRLAHLGQWIALFGVSAATLAFIIELFWMLWLHTLSWEGIGGAFVSSIVLIVACVPEGLPTIVAMDLAIHVLRMAKQRALVRKLVACETIGCVTYICTDKTGTLTENRMAVRCLCNTAGKEDTLPEVLWENICINSTATLREDRQTFTGNPTEGALLVTAAQHGLVPEILKQKATIAHVEPFSSDKKCMSTLITSPHRRELLKGSPEHILSRCVLPPEVRTRITQALAYWQKQACRVLAFAHRDTTEGAFCYDGFAAIADPVRGDVPAALRACRQAGIHVLMLTGDNLLTATAIAQELDLFSDETTAVTAHDLEALDDEAFAKKLRTVRVVARSTPMIKRRVVQALQAMGETVAVTGDGINDAPAIRAADVGVAMGISGTEVTKSACDILLLDDAFTTIVRAIRWGRGILDNFRRFILFQLTVNVSSVVVVLLTVLFGGEPPFSALELLWINVIMDGPPALCLGLERMHEDLLKRAPVRRDAPLISSTMLFRMLLIGCGIALLALGQLHFNFLNAQPHECSTVFFTLFVCCQLANALCSRFPDGGNPFSHLTGNPALALTLTLALGLQWMIVTYGGRAFGTEPLSWYLWMKCLAISACLPLAFAFFAGVQKICCQKHFSNFLRRGEIPPVEGSEIADR